MPIFCQTQIKNRGNKSILISSSTIFLVSNGNSRSSLSFDKNSHKIEKRKTRKWSWAFDISRSDGWIIQSSNNNFKGLWVDIPSYIDAKQCLLIIKLWVWIWSKEYQLFCLHLFISVWISSKACNFSVFTFFYFELALSFGFFSDSS